jgi:hypothetical protein
LAVTVLVGHIQPKVEMDFIHVGVFLKEGFDFLKGLFFAPGKGLVEQPLGVLAQIDVALKKKKEGKKENPRTKRLTLAPLSEAER